MFWSSSKVLEKIQKSSMNLVKKLFLCKEKPHFRRSAVSLSRNPTAHYAATGFLVYTGQKKRKRERRKWSFHFHTASFFRFMAANLSFTQLVT